MRRAALLGILLLGAVPRAAAGMDEAPFAALAGAHWMGVYLRGEKAGWVRITLAREEADGRGTWVLSTESLLRFTVLDRRLELRGTERSTFRDTAPYALASFESRVITDGTELRRSARPDGDAFVLETVRGSARSTLRGALKHTALDVFAAELLVLRGAAPGARRTVVLFLSELLAEEEGEAQVLAAEPQPDGTTRVTVETRGSRFTRRDVFAPDGTCLESRLGPGYVLRREEEERARALGSGADLWALSRTPPLEAPLGDPRALRRLVLDLTGAPPGLPGGTPAPDGSATRVACARAARPEPVAAAPASLAAFLAPEPSLPCDHPKIAGRAADITAGAVDLFERSSRVVRWVHETLEKRDRVQLPSALDVLEKGYGDCTEHALLCAALLRACGVPARVVTGLVYCGDATRAFGVHAWVEAWCGDWVAVDPALGQVLADATHVKFAEGLDPYGLLVFTGELKVRVVAAETD